MSQSDKQLWIERIARALAELKKGAAAEVRGADPSGESREPRQPGRDR
jgi:hypothetical protein